MKTKMIKGWTEVYATKIFDERKLTNSIKVRAFDKEFNVSQSVTIMDYKEGLSLEKRLGYFKFVCNLDKRAVEIITKNIIQQSRSFKVLTTKNNMNIRQVFGVMHKEFNQELDENKVRINKEFNIINPGYFKEITEGCGWKALDVKKELLEMDMLKTNSPRLYDYNIKINKKNSWWLCIDKKALEEEANIVEISKGGEE